MVAIKKLPSQVIYDLQHMELENLKLRAEALIKSAEETLQKIDQAGIKGYYSMNHDCMRHASALWTSSLRLGELRRLSEALLQDNLLDKHEENSGNIINDKEITNAKTTLVSDNSVEISGSTGKSGSTK
jgi:hypothetical protein